MWCFISLLRSYGLIKLISWYRCILIEFTGAIIIVLKRFLNMTLLIYITIILLHFIITRKSYWQLLSSQAILVTLSWEWWFIWFWKSFNRGISVIRILFAQFQLLFDHSYWINAKIIGYFFTVDNSTLLQNLIYGLLTEVPYLYHLVIYDFFRDKCYTFLLM